MFHKFSSIENAYQSEFLERIEREGFAGCRYVVQEKAHGANMSFITDDGKHFVAARRTALLESGEKFYGYEKVLDKLIPQLKALWLSIKNDVPDLEQMTVFGELIGGDYRHPEVARNKEATMIQKGIYYTPDNAFYAYDIMLNKNYYLNVEKANHYFEMHHLLYAKTLFAGSLDECLGFPNDKPSEIYQAFSLPETEDNVMEGVVIRPAEPCYLSNGSRVMIKNKNGRWEEKAKRKKRIVIHTPPSDQVVAMQQAIDEYITDNRLSNVLSKTGQATPQKMGEILAMYSRDVMDDFLKDNAAAFNELEKKEQKAVTKIINSKVVPLLKKRM